MSYQNSSRHLNDHLPHFGVNANYYKHLGGYFYSAGVKYIAEIFKLYWLIGEIVVANYPSVFEQFQIWKLKKELANDRDIALTFQLSCEDRYANRLYVKCLAIADFPYDSIELWFFNDVILLPSEWKVPFLSIT